MSGTDGVPAQAAVRTQAQWPLYEVFVRGKRGLNHVHVGSLRAADDHMALTHARDLYTRRNEGVSIWAVRSDTIAASTPGEKDPFFAPSGDKVYRHPTFTPFPTMSPTSRSEHMSDEDLYVDADNARWAFGTGFTDPLHGVDQAVPDGVDAADLVACCLALGDDALVSAQRLAEWCTRALELEEELALANIGLDMLGQARLLYARAGQADGTGRGEDAYAYFRDPDDFRNVRLAELPCGDFAFTVTRLLVMSAWRLALCEALTAAPDPVLAAIAAKSVKELAYHAHYAAGWTVRLGDGTSESRARLEAALGDIAPWLTN